MSASIILVFESEAQAGGLAQFLERVLSMNQVVVSWSSFSILILLYGPTTNLSHTIFSTIHIHAMDRALMAIDLNKTIKELKSVFDITYEVMDGLNNHWTKTSSHST